MGDENRSGRDLPGLERILVALPQVVAGKGVWQNKFHEFDVYGHTIEYVRCVKEMTSDIELVVAGYLHDIGKPVVAKPKFKDGVPQQNDQGFPYHEFDDHERVGEGMVRAMPARMFVDFDLDQERIARLVGAHYLPMQNIKRMRKAATYDSFVEQYGMLGQALDATSLSRADVMTMFLADCLSKGKGCTDIDELRLARDVILGDGDQRLLASLYALQKRGYGGKE
ncbi:MAG: HD domain-containing protein [Nanoarchaeota archaeon]